MLAWLDQRAYVGQDLLEINRMRVLASALVLLASCSSAALAAIPLAAHHAVYSLSYDSDQPGNSEGNIVGARGTMTYDIDDACTGWATDQRLQITLTNRDGQDIQMVSDYATFEAKDGLHMEFHMKQTTDTAVTQKLDGSASLEQAGHGGSVSYVTPAAKTMALPAGTLFPMAHTAAILAAAEAGKKFLTLPLFDGTGPDGAQDTFVTVLDWGTKQKLEWPELASLPSGRVHISFFDRDKPGSGQTPDYEIGMRYFANGVANDLRMNFGEFVMTGTLKTFQPAPAPHC